MCFNISEERRDKSMKTGFFKRDVTPDRSCRMGGYDRKQKSTGVLDPIQVNYMSLEVDQKVILFAMIDCICLEKSFVEEIQEEVSKIIGIAKHQIIISCIHTHSAPCYFKLTFESVPAETALTQNLKEQIKKDLLYCHQHMQTSTLQYETCMIDGLYGNRNVKDGWSDKSFHVLKFFHNNQLIGSFVNISTHPTLLNGDNLLLSADLLGHVRNQLEQQLQAPVFISNGTCGDVSTRFYRDGHEDLDQIAHAILQQYNQKKTTENITLDQCELKDIAYDSTSDFKNDPIHLSIRKRVEADDTNPMKDLFLHKCDIKEAMGKFTLQLRSLIIDYGNIMIITLPGDILSAFGKKIKAAFPNKIVIFICYSGNYCNYFVPEEEYGKYFETFNSRLQIGEADKFIQKIINLAK